MFEKADNKPLDQSQLESIQNQPAAQNKQGVEKKGHAVGGESVRKGPPAKSQGTEEKIDKSKHLEQSDSSNKGSKLGKKVSRWTGRLGNAVTATLRATGALAMAAIPASHGSDSTSTMWVQDQISNLKKTFDKDAVKLESAITNNNPKEAKQILANMNKQISKWEEKAKSYPSNEATEGLEKLKAIAQSGAEAVEVHELKKAVENEVNYKPDENTPEKLRLLGEKLNKLRERSINNPLATKELNTLEFKIKQVQVSIAAEEAVKGFNKDNKNVKFAVENGDLDLAEKISNEMQENLKKISVEVEEFPSVIATYRLETGLKKLAEESRVAVEAAQQAAQAQAAAAQAEALQAAQAQSQVRLSTLSAQIENLRGAITDQSPPEQKIEFAQALINRASTSDLKEADAILKSAGEGVEAAAANKALLRAKGLHGAMMEAVAVPHNHQTNVHVKLEILKHQGVHGLDEEELEKTIELLEEANKFETEMADSMAEIEGHLAKGDYYAAAATIERTFGAESSKFSDYIRVASDIGDHSELLEKADAKRTKGKQNWTSQQVSEPWFQNLAAEVGKSPNDLAKTLTNKDAATAHSTYVMRLPMLLGEIQKQLTNSGHADPAAKIASAKSNTDDFVQAMQVGKDWDLLDEMPGLEADDLQKQVSDMSDFELRNALKTLENNIKILKRHEEPKFHSFDYMSRADVPGLEKVAAFYSTELAKGKARVKS